MNARANFNYDEVVNGVYDNKPTQQQVDFYVAMCQRKEVKVTIDVQNLGDLTKTQLSMMISELQRIPFPASDAQKAFLQSLVRPLSAKQLASIPHLMQHMLPCPATNGDLLDLWGIRGEQCKTAITKAQEIVKSGKAVRLIDDVQIKEITEMLRCPDIDDSELRIIPDLIYDTITPLENKLEYANTPIKHKGGVALFQIDEDELQVIRDKVTKIRAFIAGFESNWTLSKVLYVQAQVFIEKNRPVYTRWNRNIVTPAQVQEINKFHRKLGMKTVTQMEIGYMTQADAKTYITQMEYEVRYMYTPIDKCFYPANGEQMVMDLKEKAGLTRDMRDKSENPLWEAICSIYYTMDISPRDPYMDTVDCSIEAFEEAVRLAHEYSISELKRRVNALGVSNKQFKSIINK